MKLKYDKLLSNFAFNCNLRHYTWAGMLLPPGEGGGAVQAVQVYRTGMRNVLVGLWIHFSHQFAVKLPNDNSYYGAIDHSDTRECQPLHLNYQMMTGIMAQRTNLEVFQECEPYGLETAMGEARRWRAAVGGGPDPALGKRSRE